jgi:adenine deaminase
VYAGDTMQDATWVPIEEDGLAPTIDELAHAVGVAADRRPADLWLADGRLLNVFSGRVERVDVAVAGRLVAAVLPAGAAPIRARERLELDGAYLAPGLIDGHVHVESSLVTPAAYARAVLPHGVVGVVNDPHEIANVAGLAGVRWWLACGEGLPFDLWTAAPSCVPSTPFETAGAELGIGEIDDLLAHPRVVGVAELMSFPGVIAGEAAQLAKVAVADHAGKNTEGHAPGLSGRDLQAYLAAGVGSDHESTGLAEGREKLAAGVFLMVREGSVTRDLEALLPLVTPRHADRIGFVTDDRLPHDLLAEGAVDVLVRRAIAAGVDPVYAVRCGSWNTARHYRLPRRGAVAPGYFADLLVIDDLASFRVARVLRHGRWVAEAGRTTAATDAALAAAAASAERRPEAARLRGSVCLPDLSGPALSIPAPAAGRRVRVLRPLPGQVVTEALETLPPLRGGEVVADPERDLLKLACVHRHGRAAPGTGIGLGLVAGLGLRRGALASSVGHDHHNLMLVGADDGAMRRAAERVAELGGGFVVDDGERIVAELALPVAGLVSDAPVERVVADLDAIDAAVRALGGSGSDALMTLSFLGLAVIPALRVTDHGLVDVVAARLVALEA